MGIGPRKCKSNQPPLAGAASRYTNRPHYLNWVEIELKDDFSFVPRLCHPTKAACSDAQVGFRQAEFLLVPAIWGASH